MFCLSPLLSATGYRSVPIFTQACSSQLELASVRDAVQSHISLIGPSLLWGWEGNQGNVWYETRSITGTVHFELKSQISITPDTTCNMVIADTWHTSTTVIHEMAYQNHDYPFQNITRLFGYPST